MKHKLPWILLIVVWVLAGMASPVRADGIIIPPPCPTPDCPPHCIERDCPPFPPRPMEQLVIRYHHVTVTIEDQIAVTRVDQVFYNPNSWEIEGTYLFPLPLDAVVTNFTLWVDGKPVKGEVLDAEEAREIYEDTVRELRDPALLEYEGRGAMKASIFPIAPEGERRIELEYTQALTAENGLVRYVYPLNTEKFSMLPLEDVSVKVEIRDEQAIRAVYSPSHAVDISREGQNYVKAGYEATETRPDSDFSLYYSLGDTEAFHMFSYRDPANPGEEDGFFMLLLAPKPAPDGGENERVAKDILLVLDRSGSMEGEKFQQAQVAMRYILQQLNPEDRFYLQAFSTGLETYASGLRSADEVNEALNWVDRLSARGSTDINRALLEAAAAADRERPTYLIFLTDGLPTEGVVDRQEILNNFAKTAPDNLRLFSFGVGYDVDTFLLDTLSQEHHGQSTYVRPGEPLDETVSGFYERISTPVLTGLTLDFGSMAVYDIYPDPLPDLFSGSQVLVVGRYREGGTADVTLRGSVNGVDQSFRYPKQTFARDSRGAVGNLEMLPRLWATRKIGYLLNQVRLQGPDKETIQQIVNLSVRYGIVTPYTSYLVTEPMPLGVEAQERIAEEAFGQAQAAPLDASGKGAVERAAQEGDMRAADVAPAAPGMGGGGEAGFPMVEGSNSQGTIIRVVGTRTFVLQGDIWMDTTYDPRTMKAAQVQFLSDDYFKLLNTRPDLAASLALGNQVIMMVDGKAYQVVQEGAATGNGALPPALPTQVGNTTPAVKETNSQPSATTVPGTALSATPEAVAKVDEQRSPSPRTCAAGFLPLLLFAAVIWRTRQSTR